MKSKLLLLFFAFAVTSKAQNITFSNFSQSLTDTIPINIANNSSFNVSLPTTIGYNVTWDASSLSLQVGFPTVNLSFHPSSSTPQGTQYPASNYCEFDPNLTSVVDYNYAEYTTDSIVDWGSYSPNTSHEIFQNPDKRLIFPFAFGQSFTDTYSKTNYSNSTTISSYQTGNRTVSYAGYGTLILPQGYFWDVALVKETRTNSLGSDSYIYTWFELNSGKKLLYRSENGSSVTTAWCADPASEIGLKENKFETTASLYPNPLITTSEITIHSSKNLLNPQIKLFDMFGHELRTLNVDNSKTLIKKEDLRPGIYFYTLVNDGNELTNGKFVVQD